MLTPYAIVRSCEDPAAFTDAHDAPLVGVHASGLTLLVGEAIDARADAEAFMDAVTDVHESCACVPMRLGEPLENETAGRRLIETGADRFHKLLDQLEGVDEWSIVVQPPAVLQQVEAKPLGAGDAGRGYLEQRRRDLDVAGGMRPEVSAVLAELSRSFAPVVRETRTLPGAEGAGSLAMLIDRKSDAIAAFRERTSCVALPCTLTGPWPAFSFVSLS